MLTLDNEDLRDILALAREGGRNASGEGNNIDNPLWGTAGQPFIRLTEAVYADGAAGIRGTALTPREISDILANQDNDGDGVEESIPNAFDGSALLTFFGQYFDHGLGFIAKGTPGSVAIGSDSFPISAPRSNIIPGTGVDPDGIPNSGDEIAAQYINNTSPIVDQNQAYGSHDAVTDLLRAWTPAAGGGAARSAYLLTGEMDATGRHLLPTLDHIRENYRVMTGGEELTSADISNYRGTGQALLLDFIPVFKPPVDGAPPELDLDAIGHYFIAGDGRLNENVMLTSIHTIWARNHNFWVDELKARTGGQWTEDEYFEGARAINIAEYQQIVFTEFANAMSGGLGDDDDGPDLEHGFDAYDPTVDASISVEFAQAAYRFGHSMLNETVGYLGADGSLQQMSLVNAFLSPQTVTEIGIDSLLGGAAVERHQAIDLDMVNALRNQLVGRPLDLAALNIFRGRDMGIAPFNEVRAQLFEQTGLRSLRPYTGWDDFQSRNRLSDDVMAELKAAYPDGFETMDLWIGGLAERPTMGQLGSTFGYIFNEQLDRLQHGDRFYYLEIFDDQLFLENPVTFADIVMRNTDLTDLPSAIFSSATVDPVTPVPEPDPDPEPDPEEEDPDVPPDTGGDPDPEPEPDPDPEPEQPVEGEAPAVVFGTAGKDAILGGSGPTTVFADAGDDVFVGAGSADIVFGDEGADRLFGEVGDDYIEAGAGDDRVFGGAGDDLIVTRAGDGDDVYYGDDGSDTLDMSAISAAVTANLGTGFMMRGAVSSAQTGSDVLWSVENIITGSGDDVITASSAVNIMDGGAGEDTFRFLSAQDADGDVIFGFEPGDKIDLSQIDADRGMAGRQAFTLTTASTLTERGQLIVTQEAREDGEYTVIAGRTGDSAEADFKISLKGLHDLSASDFV